MAICRRKKKTWNFSKRENGIDVGEEMTGRLTDNHFQRGKKLILPNWVDNVGLG